MAVSPCCFPSNISNSLPVKIVPSFNSFCGQLQPSSPKALIWPQFCGDDKLWQIVTNPKSNSLCKPPRIETLKRNEHVKKLHTPSISIICLRLFQKPLRALSPAKLIRNTFGRSSGSHHLSFQPHQGLITITCDAWSSPSSSKIVTSTPHVEHRPTPKIDPFLVLKSI